MAQRSSARLDQGWRPPRPRGQLLRPAAPRMVRSGTRSGHRPPTRSEDDRRRPLHAPPLHGLQPTAADRGAPLVSAIDWYERNGRATVRAWTEVLSSDFTTRATDNAAAIPIAGAGGRRWGER